MEKKKIILLGLCAIYTILSLICFINVKETAVFNIIQFIILYIPFFACILFDKKKWMLYFALFFSGLELLTGLLGVIVNIKTLSEVTLNMSIILAFIENILRILITGLMFVDIISILRCNKRKINIIYASLITVLFGVLCYDVFRVIVWAPELKLLSILSISRGYLFIVIISLIAIFLYYDENLESINENN